MEAEPILRELDLFMQDEKNAIALFQTLAERESFAELRARFRAFAADCQRHLQLLHNLVLLLGGRPDASRHEIEASAGLHAALADLAAVDYGLARLHRVEALLLAARKCKANWELLHTLADAVPSQPIEDAVHQVQPDKTVHLAYLVDLHRDLGLRLLSPSVRRALQAPPVPAS